MQLLLEERALDGGHPVTDASLAVFSQKKRLFQILIIRKQSLFMRKPIYYVLYL